MKLYDNMIVKNYGVICPCCVTNDTKSSGVCMTTRGARNWHASTSRKRWLRMLTKNCLTIQIHQYGQTKDCSAYVWPQIWASGGLRHFLSKLIMVFASFPYSFWVKLGSQIFQNVCPIQDCTMIMKISVLVFTEASRNCGEDILFFLKLRQI